MGTTDKELFNEALGPKWVLVNNAGLSLAALTNINAKVSQTNMTVAAHRNTKWQGTFPGMQRWGALSLHFITVTLGKQQSQ